MTKRLSPRKTIAADCAALELAALRGIAESDFQDGAPTVGKPVWSWSANPFKSKRQFSGVVSNLVQKGLATASGEGKDACLALTQAGLDAIEAPKPTPVDAALAKIAVAATAPAATLRQAKPTKKSRTLELLRRPGGCTLSDIAHELSVTTKAAQSLVGDVRRMGIQVTSARAENGVSTFTAEG